MPADPRIFGVPLAATALGMIPAARIATMMAEARALAGLTPEEVERRTGGVIRAKEILAFEAGDDMFSEQDLRRLAGALGYPVELIIAVRARLVVDVATRKLHVGDYPRKLKDASNYDRVLVDYLSALYDIRGKEVGTPLALREDDLAELGRATGHSAKEVRRHLDELMTYGYRMREQRSAQRRRLFYARVAYGGVAAVIGTGIGAAFGRFVYGR